jgi:hypothetical protein
MSEMAKVHHISHAQPDIGNRILCGVRAEMRFWRRLPGITRGYQDLATTYLDMLWQPQATVTDRNLP